MANQAEGHASPAEVTQSAQWLRAAFLLLIAVCTYSHVPLVSGGRLLVPSFPTVALTPILLLAVRRDLSLADVMFGLKVAFVLLLSIALSPGYAHMEEKLLAMIQFLAAIGVAVLIVRLMQQLSPKSLERGLLFLWCLILVGSILEVLDVIRAPSDAFRAWAYEELYGIYDADLRDVNLVGWLRPKLFSEEPSHVTKFFIASVNAWLLVRVTWRKAVVVAGATVAMLVIMGSPMLLVSAAITLAIVALESAPTPRFQGGDSGSCFAGWCVHRSVFCGIDILDCRYARRERSRVIVGRGDRSASGDERRIAPSLPGPCGHCI